MFLFLIKWFKGYIKIEISGNSKDRFINICANHGIIFFDIAAVDESIHATISKKNYKLIKKYIKKTDVKIKILDKKGFPFFFYKYRKRKCFALGFFIFLAIIYSFTLFIWDINVTGESAYTSEQIIKEIKNNYVQIGSLKSKIDCNDLEKKLREQYDKIAWISCEIKGTRLNITLTETIETGKIIEETAPCNIIAAKDGIITDIVIRAGTVVAHKGDEVKKGDIIITGAVNIYNDYDELIETNYIPASGDVYAISEYNYDDSFDLNYYKKEYTDNTKKYYSLIFFDNILTPFTPKNNYKNKDYLTTEKQIKFGDTIYLPLGIKINEIKEYTPVNATYTTEEAKEKATKKLTAYLSDLSKKGVEILENNVTIYISDGICHSHGTIVTKEPIGVPSRINITNQGEGL